MYTDDNETMLYLTPMTPKLCNTFLPPNGWFFQFVRFFEKVTVKVPEKANFRYVQILYSICGEVYEKKNDRKKRT